MSENINQFPMLREEQRIEARQRARENLLNKLGGEPQIEQYESQQWSRFGKRWDNATLIACFLVLIAAFVISAIHIFATGQETTLSSGGGALTAKVIGGMLVLLAESAILALSLIPTVWDVPKRVALSMYAGIGGSAFIATVGNINATILYTDSPFSWLGRWAQSFATEPNRWALATLPPVLTVLVGQGLKYYALRRSYDRLESKRQFDEAMLHWRVTIGTIEDRDDWRNAYAWALWDTWKKGKRREYVADITGDERRAIIRREMDADQFFEDEKPAISMKLLQGGGERPAGQVDKVIAWWQEDPARFHLSGVEIAETLQVSEATVTRARPRFSSNGHTIEG